MPNPSKSNHWSVEPLLNESSEDVGLYKGQRSILYGYNGSSYQPLRIDSSTRAINTIDYAHHEIHDGSAFTVEHYAESKNDGQTINVYIKTPNSAKWLHVFMNWSSGGAAYARIYEAPTITSNSGTNGVSVFNRNRNSSTASGIFDNATSPAVNKVGTDVTKTANGTIIYVEYAGAAKSQGAFARADKEFILLSNAVYLFEIESDAAGITLNFDLTWYEHTDQGA